MNSLIIGSSSQLAQYFPKEYERIDSHFIKEGLPLPLKQILMIEYSFVLPNKELF
mgnify:CR=1 FL=1